MPDALGTTPILRAAAMRAPHTSSLVRPGKPVFLLCQANGLKISMKVMPLKQAGLNENVQVLDPETRRVFLARVVGVNRVESDMREAR